MCYLYRLPIAYSQMTPTSQDVTAVQHALLRQRLYSLCRSARQKAQVNYQTPKCQDEAGVFWSDIWGRLLKTVGVIEKRQLGLYVFRTKKKEKKRQERKVCI